jgi:hypothetical protein
MINDHLNSKKARTYLGVAWRTPRILSEHFEGSSRPIKIGPALLWSADHLDARRAVHPTGQKDVRN